MVTAKHIALDKNHHHGIRDALSMQLLPMNQREMGHVLSYVSHKTDYLFSSFGKHLIKVCSIFFKYFAIMTRYVSVFFSGE